MAFSCQSALSSALSDACVQVITYVPGHPVTELCEVAGAEISVNEKVALEVALGASATGCRSMAIVKNVGMNILSDPLVISASTGIKSGLAVLVGDDIGPKGSQVEMDSRFYGPLAEIPVLDAASPQDLYSCIIEAFSISETIGCPAVVRVASTVLEMKSETLFEKRGLMPSLRAFERSLRDQNAKERHNIHHKSLLVSQAASEACAVCKIVKGYEVGIIASGRPGAISQETGASVLVLRYVYPLPWRLIRRFVERHRYVLVAEEPETFIEGQLQMSPKVYGKLTGHIPRGAVGLEDLRRAMDAADRGTEKVEPVANQGRGGRAICDDCPFLPVFRAVGRFGVPVAGDVGCSFHAARPPLGTVDMIYGLGSSIGVASGFSRKGIALIGDYALAHSGLQGLINAVWKGREVLAVVIKNDSAAMTGGQEVPDLIGILEAVVPVKKVQLPSKDEYVETILRQELSRPGANAVVFQSTCTGRPATGSQSSWPQE